MDTVYNLALIFGSLAGVAALGAALVNLLKVVGVVTDGTSARWYALYCLLAFFVVAGLGLFRGISAATLDTQAGQLAFVLIFLTTFLGQMGLGPLVHRLFVWLKLPGVGVSFSTSVG